MSTSHIVTNRGHFVTHLLRSVYAKMVMYMQYNYRTGAERARKIRPFWIALPTIGLICGLYLLANTLYPMLPANVNGQSDMITKKLTEQKPELKQNRLYIPKIAVDVAIVTGVTADTLEGGAWHRKPEQGDPQKGGNFILAAHRFNLGLTPDQTRAKSPF